MKELVKYLRRLGVLHSSRIVEAFLAIDRKNFVPDGNKDEAYIDEAMPIGWGQTISQPYTVAFMLELLNPQPGDVILDIGSGSGWQSAILAQIVTHGIGSRGKVHALEIVSELCDVGTRNVSKYHFIKNGIVEFHCGDGDKTVVGDGKADKIIAAASIDCGEKNAVNCIPENWQKQLKIGGVIVVPIGQSIWKFNKGSADDFESEEHPGFAFVPYV